MKYFTPLDGMPIEFQHRSVDLADARRRIASTRAAGDRLWSHARRGSRDRKMSASSSEKVPEAGMIGFFSASPPISTSIFHHAVAS